MRIRAADVTTGSVKMNIGDDTEDVALNFGEEDELNSNKRFKHPIAVFFHLTFRTLAIVTYLLCGWFSDSFIVNFVIIVLLLSMDFWTVKNITGRLLVGLRWWNQIDEDGKSQWVFESRKKRKAGQAAIFLSGHEARIFWLSQTFTLILWSLFLLRTLFTFNLKWFGASRSRITTAESRMFWMGLVVCPVFWVVFFFGTIFTLKFKWFMVVCVGLILNGANLYGYVRCKLGTQKKISSMASNFLGQQVLKSMFTKGASSQES